MEVPEELKGLVNDWKGNIYDIKDINTKWLKNPRVKRVIEAVQKIYRWDKNVESLNDLVLSKEEAIVVAVMTNTKELIMKLEEEESEEIRMCEVFDSFVREREQQGIKQGELQAKIKMLCKLLTKKLGFVSKDLMMKVEVSPEDKLDQLTIKIFDIENEKDVLDILN